MAVKVAINGLGRICRCVARIIADRDDIELVAVNASGKPEMLEYNLKYDSVHGVRKDVEVSEGYLKIGKDKAKIFATRDLSELDFAGEGA
jgi:glyceraldehyde 3-phosphate dehydrogenase